MGDETRDAAQQEREMREHEREARERDPDERRPGGDAVTDTDADKPAPPGQTGHGGPAG